MSRTPFFFFGGWGWGFGFQNILPCPILDHSPMMLERGLFGLERHSPFCFENMLLKDERFLEMVKTH